MDKAMHSEFEEAVRMANKALDVPNADPDDNLRIVSRQFLRSIDMNQSLRSELQKQKELNKEAIALLDNIMDDMKNEDWNTWWIKQIESLIKKSKPA